MAVYTEVSFEALGALLEHYDIGEPTSFKGIAEGVENSNYLLHTTKGHFILTLYEKRVAAADLPFFLSLMRHLAAQGLPCPVPIASKTGAMTASVKGRPAAILTFLDGISLRRPQPAHCEAAGEALAQLHLAGRGFGMTRPNALGPSGWHTLVEATRCQADRVQEGLALLITRSHDELLARWPDRLPDGIIHADLFPDNVLFANGAVSGLIDFYFACNDALAYDLAVMLNSWCFEADGAFNVTKSKALLKGYRRGRELEAAEVLAMPLLCAGAALRFTLTRLYDWLHPDNGALVRPKDPREFARALRFHLSVKSAGEYGI
jgi:homoserine kinase type II